MFYKSKTVIILLKILQVSFEVFFRIYTKHPRPCYMGVAARRPSPFSLELCINMTAILNHTADKSRNRPIPRKQEGFEFPDRVE